MKKPHLVVEIENPSDVHQGKYKILNLKVKNKRSAGILKFSNQTATQVRVYLTFKTLHQKQTYLLQLLGGTPHESLLHQIIKRWMLG